MSTCSCLLKVRLPAEVRDDRRTPLTGPLRTDAAAPLRRRLKKPPWRFSAVCSHYGLGIDLSRDAHTLRTPSAEPLCRAGFREHVRLRTGWTLAAIVRRADGVGGVRPGQFGPLRGRFGRSELAAVFPKAALALYVLQRRSVGIKGKYHSAAANTPCADLRESRSAKKGGMPCRLR
jgi:hypothetical protein